MYYKKSKLSPKLAADENDKDNNIDLNNADENNNKENQ
jgi:hypothetical protein